MTKFEKKFWTEKVSIYSEERTVIVGGQHYMVSWDNSLSVCPNHCKGFGGHDWMIEWYNGVSGISDNLFSQGKIPEEFRDKLKDNATFNTQFSSLYPKGKVEYVLKRWPLLIPLYQEKNPIFQDYIMDMRIHPCTLNWIRDNQYAINFTLERLKGK